MAEPGAARKTVSYRLSRSEKKRRAKTQADLAQELVTLSAGELKKCIDDKLLREDILHAQGLKAGARKRQLKYISKQLRDLDNSKLLDFLAAKKGSHLKQTTAFHELERFRDDLIDDALALQDEAWHQHEQPATDWTSITLEEVCRRFPAVDRNTIRSCAMAFARSHQKRHSRELFRLLKAAAEDSEFQASEKRQ